MPLSPSTRANIRCWLVLAGGVAAALYLLSLLTLFVHLSLHWPLVGDAPLLHYCVFLLRHGWAPYRQLIDPNLPGTYAVEAAVTGLFGYGAPAWRLFDLLLLALLGVAALWLLGSRLHAWRGALAALWVTTLFALEHGRRYRKLGEWPALGALLAQHYTLAEQWKPQEQENWNGHPALPYGFRLYALR